MQPHVPSSGVIVVDLDALARNWRLLAGRAHPAECAAVVKANAYGLGLAPVSQRLAREGCRTFFVASAAEGIALRELLPRARIFVLDGPAPDTIGNLRDAELTPVLNSYTQVQLWSGTGAGAALHIDTGMSRLGLGAREVNAVVAEPQLLAGIEIACVLTHLACADVADHPMSARQLERFEQLRRLLPDAPTSIANTAGLYLGDAYRGDIARPGIGLYGGNPFTGRDNPFDEVVRLTGRILQLRDVEEPGTVGYGATHDAAPPERLAIVGVGYADGYRRALGNRAFASCADRRVPVVGRVSMDYLCVDVTAVPAHQLAVGDPVQLIGGNVPLDEIAAAAGTISYEILTGLGDRLVRQYLESE